MDLSEGKIAKQIEEMWCEVYKALWGGLLVPKTYHPVKATLTTENDLLFGNWFAQKATSSPDLTVAAFNAALAQLKVSEKKFVNAVGQGGGVPGLLSLFPGLKRYSAACPSSGCGPSMQTLYHLVQHLNDAHKWTREAIADWLDAGAKEHGWDLSARGVLVTPEGIVKVDAPTEGEADAEVAPHLGAIKYAIDNPGQKFYIKKW